MLILRNLELLSLGKCVIVELLAGNHPSYYCGSRIGCWKIRIIIERLLLGAVVNVPTWLDHAVPRYLVKL